MQLVVKKSPIGGKGVFTKTFIPKGQSIFNLSGERISLSEVWTRIRAGKLSIDDPLQIGEEMFLVLEKKLSYFFNHSCNPNAGIRKESELFALRDIKGGEEITYDYSTTESPDAPWAMKCICGAPNCRKSIGGVLSIPKEQFQRYKELGAFPDYLKKHFEYAQGNSAFKENPKREGGDV